MESRLDKRFRGIDRRLGDLEKKIEDKTADILLFKRVDYLEKKLLK